MGNKVKFNLKNVHAAKLTEKDAEGMTTFTYGTPKAIPGAVSISLDAEGESSPFYADGIVYFRSVTNNGYSGDLEIALIPEWFRTEILQEKLDNGAAMYTAVLVDREKKQDAGFVTVTYNRDTSFGEIEMLYLLEEYRGQGMGKKLFKMALSCLDINCIRDRKLCVTYGNEAALRLYESFGFYPFTIDCLQKRS